MVGQNRDHRTNSRLLRFEKESAGSRSGNGFKTYLCEGREIVPAGLATSKCWPTGLRLEH